MAMDSRPSLSPTVLSVRCGEGSSQSNVLVKAAVEISMVAEPVTIPKTWFDATLISAIGSEQVEDSRRLIHNVHASSEPKMHTVLYNAAVTVSKPEPNGQEREYTRVQTNDEAQSPWVQSLSIGDAIVTVPKDRFLE